MSRADDGYDNAFMESCFETINTELELTEYESVAKRRLPVSRVLRVLQPRPQAFQHRLSNTITVRNQSIRPEIRLRRTRFPVTTSYYWATHNGTELDLLLFQCGHRIGVECKRAVAPTLTPSMRIALTDLKLDKLYVVYPGEKRYALTCNVEVVPLSQLVNAK